MRTRYIVYGILNLVNNKGVGNGTFGMVRTNVRHHRSTVVGMVSVEVHTAWISVVLWAIALVYIVWSIGR